MPIIEYLTKNAKILEKKIHGKKEFKIIDFINNVWNYGIIDFEDPSQVLQKLQVLSEDIKKEALINLIYLY